MSFPPFRQSAVTYTEILGTPSNTRSGTQTFLATNSLYKPSNSILSSLFPPFSGKTKRPKAHELPQVFSFPTLFQRGVFVQSCRGKHKNCYPPSNPPPFLPRILAGSPTQNRSGTQALLATNSLYKPANSILSSLFPPFSGKTKRPKVHELPQVFSFSTLF